jgi:hypothetical protein
VDILTQVLIDVDPQVAFLPAKALIHHIWRRYPKNNLPYKPELTAGFSKLGIKRICAGCEFLMIAFPLHTLSYSFSICFDLFPPCSVLLFLSHPFFMNAYLA